MITRNTALGIAAFFAVALSAFSVASASAESTTAYTCVKDAGGTFLGAHCLSTGSGEKYKHVAFNTKTTTTGTNANTAEETKAARSAILKGSLSGVVTEITCGELHGEGFLENKETASKEMYIHLEGKLHFTNCVVKAPAGKGCKVKEETITTGELTGSSEGLSGELKVTPKEGSTFVSITIEGCSISALNNTFPLTGSFKAKSSGATLTTTHADITTQNTLKFGGTKAGFDLGLTLKAHEKEGQETNPIVSTK
jgi:hypothetical protein